MKLYMFKLKKFYLKLKYIDMENDSDTFEVIADRAFYIEHEPTIKEKEKKKKKDPKGDDTINKPTRKKREKKSS